MGTCTSSCRHRSKGNQRVADEPHHGRLCLCLDRHLKGGPGSAVVEDVDGVAVVLQQQFHGLDTGALAEGVLHGEVKREAAIGAVGPLHASRRVIFQQHYDHRHRCALVDGDVERKHAVPVSNRGRLGVLVEQQPNRVRVRNGRPLPCGYRQVKREPASAGLARFNEKGRLNSRTARCALLPERQVSKEASELLDGLPVRLDG